MPTYQYACTDRGCGATFERVQSFTDAPVAECPECAQPVRKVYSSVGVVFKGSGFYRTDSRNEARNEARANGPKNASKNGAKPAAASNGAESAPGSDASTNGASGDAAAKNGSPGPGSASSGSNGSRAATSTKAATPA